MKWTFVIQQKLKVAVLLGIVMCLVVLFNIVLQKNISDINRSVDTMYKDRLIPVTDIFHLSESLHQRQLAMENFLLKTDNNVDELQSELNKYDQRMFSLLDKYEKTYLVKEELASLKIFKQSVNNYAALERKILSLTAAGKKLEGIKLYEAVGRHSFSNTISQLSELTTIQSSVGGKLVNDTRGIVATSNFLSHLQMVLAIIIGAMIVNLVVSSKVINQTQENFKWN